MDRSSLTDANFPSNSKTARGRNGEPQKKEIKRVVKTKPKRKKKTVGSRLSEIFVEDRFANTLGYVAQDILIPAAKETLFSMITGGSSMLLFDEDNSARRGRPNNQRSFVSYSDYSNNRQEPRRVQRRRSNYEDIYLGTRAEAEDVIDYLADLIDQYGEVSVSDLYESVGMEFSHTDTKWGWYSVARASVKNTRDGYLLMLPRPVALDR